MIIDPDRFQRFVAILEQPDLDDFAALVSVAGLDPAHSFRHADLRDVDFGTVDLSDYDVSGADLTGANLVRAGALHGSSLMPPQFGRRIGSRCHLK